MVVMNNAIENFLIAELTLRVDRKIENLVVHVLHKMLQQMEWRFLYEPLTVVVQKLVDLTLLAEIFIWNENWCL